MSKILNLIVKFICFLGVLCIFNNEFAFCNEENKECCSKCYKTYVVPEQVLIFNNGIYINLDDRVVRTTSLHMDDQGLYFKYSREGDCPKGEKRCRNPDCFSCYPYWYSLCPFCNRVNWENPDQNDE